MRFPQKKGFCACFSVRQYKIEKRKNFLLTLPLFCITLQQNKASKQIQRGPDPYGCQTDSASGIYQLHGGHWPVLPENRRRCQRLRAGGAVGGTLAHRLRLRDLLLLRGGLRGLRRAVRLEVRHRRHLGGDWKRDSGLSAGLGGAGPADPHHDPAPGQRHHARVLRQALRLPLPENLRLHHHLHLPHPLHRQPVQRPVPAVRHGL